MEGRYNLGSNCLNSTNLENAYLLFKSWVAPGESKEKFVPLKDVIGKYDIPKDSQLIGVRVPYEYRSENDPLTKEIQDELSMAGSTDFILQWYREENLIYRINKILEASVVNDKQRKALSELIVSEFYHMKSEYYRDVENS